MIENLLQDIRYGIRMLAKKPSFTIVAIITLALGIGANTIVFSVVNGVLFSPLPYKNPDQLVRWWFSWPPALPRAEVTQSHLAAYRQQSQLFEKIAGYDTGDGFNLTEPGAPERLRASQVTADFFEVLGRPPLLGRGFLAEEDVPNGRHVCVLSYGLWLRRFAGDRQIVGKTISLDNSSTEVVGVMPQGFDFPANTDIWFPVGSDPTNTNSFSINPIGRMKPGVTIEQAKAEIVSMSENYARSRPDVHAKGIDFSMTVLPFKETIIENIRKPLLILLGAVAFVLLIACTNVANLLLARATSRTKEIAIRYTLGASRSRVIAQLLTESMLLAIVSAAIGLALTFAGMRMLNNLPIDGIPRMNEVSVNLPVLVFTAFLAVLTGLLFGLAPALRAAKIDLHENLKDAAKGSASTSTRRVNNLLVASQIALSLILLVGAGLLLRSFQRLLQVDPGLRPEGVLTMRFSLPYTKYEKVPQRTNFYQQTLEKIRALPGVQAAGLANRIPFGGRVGGNLYNVDPNETDSKNLVGFTLTRAVSPGYFESLGIPIEQGRSYQDSDAANGTPVVVIDHELANAQWPNQNVIGKRIRFGRPEHNNTWMTIIGVTGNIKDENFDEQATAHIYMPYFRYGGDSTYLTVRCAGNPASMTDSIRKEIAGLDSELPLYQVQTMEKVMEKSVATRRLMNLLISAFAAIALVLAMVGIYGVMSLNVSGRTQEFGIRIAIGAQRSDVLRLVLKHALIISLAGVAVGLGGAFGLTRFISSFLFGITATDPATFITVCASLVIVAVAACIVPAYRAMTVDPTVAMRSE